MLACRHWLDQELDLVDPRVVVVLGATAGQALWGSSFRVDAARGQTLAVGERLGVGTFHPSALLRERDVAAREQKMRDFVADLARADELQAHVTA